MAKSKQNPAKKSPKSKIKQAKVKKDKAKPTTAPTRRKKRNEKLVTEFFEPEDVNNVTKLVKPKQIKAPTRRKKTTKKSVTEVFEPEKVKNFEDNFHSYKLTFQNYILQKYANNKSTRVIAEHNSHRSNNERKRFSKQEQNKKLKKRCVNQISSSDNSSSSSLMESDVERDQVLNDDSSSISLTSPNKKVKTANNSCKSGTERKRTLNQPKDNEKSKKRCVRQNSLLESSSDSPLPELYIEKEKVLSDESYDVSFSSPISAKVDLNNLHPNLYPRDQCKFNFPISRSKKNSLKDDHVTQERHVLTDIEELSGINQDENIIDKTQNNVVILQNVLLEPARDNIDDLPLPSIDVVDLPSKSNSHTANVGKFPYCVFHFIKITHRILN